MATDRQKALRDGDAKIPFEDALARQRLTAQRNIVRTAARQFASSGSAQIRELSETLMGPILADHYDQVRGRFDSTLRVELPPEAAMTDEESDTLEEALAAFLAARALTQAATIAETDQADADLARLVMRAEVDRVQESEGRAIGRNEAAVIGASVLERRMRGRLSGIASFETQAVAELSKEAEARTLIGLSPIPDSSPPPPVSLPVKLWVTMGDSRVRTIHQVADGQEVPASDPFTVGGERLMYPGDTSLGASAGNVVNCRCSASHDVRKIAQMRSSL